MQAKSDAELLREYVLQTNEAAFREIVTRHADLVYASALRQVRSPELARDITQGVFADLVRKALSLGQTLADNASIVGWLYRSTRYAAHTQMRNDWRRQARERQAMENFDTSSETATDWEQIGPVLDEAMADLSDEDREALLLRYFKNHDFRAIGVALGVSDDAAQKRVSRALERLRAEFNRRGVTISAGALAAAVSANAVSVGPVGLAAALSTAALAGTTATMATQATMNWINIKSISAIVATAIAAGTATNLLQDRGVNRLRIENENLVAQQAALTSERDTALASFARNAEELERLRKGQNELPRLRGEVGMLRRQMSELESLRKENAQLQRLAQSKATDNRDTNSPPIVAKVVVTPIQQPRLITEAQVRTNISVKAGDIYDRLAVDRDVENLYGSGLFSNIRAVDKTAGEGLVIINYLVQEKSKLTGIRFRGNTKLDEPALGKILGSKVGEPFDERTVFNDVQRIQELYVNSGVSGAKVTSASNVNEAIGEAEVTFEITE